MSVLPGGARIHFPLPESLDLAWMFGFLGARALPSCEAMVEGTYRRSLRIGDKTGLIAMKPADPAALDVEHTSNFSQEEVHREVVRMLDLDAPIDHFLARRWSDPRLEQIIRRRPGIRLATYTDPFEALVRAILGQQVSVAAARTVGGRLIERFGEQAPALEGTALRAFPGPEILAALPEPDLRGIGLTGAKVTAIRAAARAVCEGTLDLYALRSSSQGIADAALRRLPGLGPWTAGYVRMRGLGDRDVLLTSDLGVVKALARLAPAEAKDPRWLKGLVEEARPFGSYLTLYLWASLAEGAP